MNVEDIEKIKFFFTKLNDVSVISSEDDILYENKNVSYIFDLILKEAKKQNVCYSSDEPFTYAYLYAVFNNIYAELTLLIGQGSFCSLKRCNKENVDIEKLVFLDNNSVTAEELETRKRIISSRELIEYIVVNKDAVRMQHITPEKIAIHAAHAATIFALECKDTDEFSFWYKEGKVQKKVLLQASEKEIRKLKYYGVEDIGCNQVEAGTLIAVSLGIMTRKQRKETPVIKRFQLFDYNKIIEGND